MKPCVPRTPWKASELLVRLVALYRHDGTPEQWRSLAIDLGRHVAEQEVRLDRIAALERQVTAMADHLQADAIIDLVGEP